MSYLSQTILDFQLVKDKISLTMKDNEIYMLRDVTSDERFDEIINEKKLLPKLSRLYQDTLHQIYDNPNEVKIYVADSSMPFYFPKNAKLSEDLAKSNSHSSGKEALQVSVTSNFFSVFQLNGSFGEKDIKNQWSMRNGDPTPIVMGIDYKEVFKLYDIITDAHGDKYKIIGFLDNNSYYVAPDKTRDIINLDKFIIKPNCVNIEDSVSISQYFDGLYLMADNSKHIDNIVKQSHKLKLFDYTPINFSYQLERIVEDTTDEIFVNSTFLIIILAFSFVGMIGNLLQFISNHKKEYAINLICGANKSHIMLRLMAQVFIMFGLGLFLVFVIFGLSKSFLLTFFCSLGFMMIVLFYPIQIISRATIQTMLKRGYE